MTQFKAIVPRLHTIASKWSTTQIPPVRGTSPYSTTERYSIPLDRAMPIPRRPTLGNEAPEKASTRDEALWRTLIANLDGGGGIADARRGLWIAAWRDYLRIWHRRRCARGPALTVAADLPDLHAGIAHAAELQQCATAVAKRQRGRSFAVTVRAWLALVLQVTAAGDQIYVLPGKLAPFFLRP